MNPPADSEALLRRAFWLVIWTILYSVLEAVVGFISGVRSGSVALMGFSIDSLIEISASAIVAHRLKFGRNEDDHESARMEGNARRFVGITFFALALYIVWGSADDLLRRTGPDKSLLGIVLAATSLTVMPILANIKLRIARSLASKSLEAEAKETLACSFLSLTLLAGLVCTALFGWWWVDAIAALAMIPWLIREGWECIEDEEIDGGSDDTDDSGKTIRNSS